MPQADIRIHNDRSRPSTLDGIPIRADILFTNHKGEEKGRLRKRKEKALATLRPALERVLEPNETVVYVTDARSPLSVIEQLTAAWWTAMLAACAIVVTNQRILFFPTKRDGSWRESVRVVHWGDIQEVKATGTLVKNVRFRLKNGTSRSYTNFHHGDHKKLAVIGAVMIPAGGGEQTALADFVQLCPHCRTALTPGQYLCPGCKLAFKNEKTMVWRSIFLPGWGYFYTGHPLIALLPAVIEGLLLLDILFLLWVGLASPLAMRRVFANLVLLVLFWTFETAITILHCRRYVRDFIPERPDAARVPQDVIVAGR